MALYNHASKWHRFKKFTLRTGQTKLHPLRTLAAACRILTSKMADSNGCYAVNDIHEINVHAATGLVLDLNDNSGTEMTCTV